MLKAHLNMGCRRRCRLIFLLCVLTCLSTAGSADSPGDVASPIATTAPCLTIIIDDMGYNLARGQRALRLPADITFAVLPFTSFGRQLATEAHAAGREVMLHVPMASPSTLATPGELSESKNRVAFARSLANAIADIPYIRGVNNHMGSQLTQQQREMSWLMENIGSRGLYFVDSRTTDLTVAASVATRTGVLNASRYVFLDHDVSRPEMAAAWQRAHHLAHQNGTAIVIAHPYPETLDFLEQVLNERPDDSVRIVPASALIKRRQDQISNQARQRAMASARSNVPS